MKKIIVGAAAAASLAACGYGANASEAEAADSSGANGNRTYAVGEFSKIEVAGPYKVEVTTGGATAVSATGDEKLLEQTEVVIKGDTLIIKPIKKLRWTWGKNGGKATFKVSTAMLNGAGIAGSGNILVDKVEGDFDGEIAGSGNIEVAAMRAGRASMEIAGSGNLRYSGTADEINIEIAGSGNAEASALSARTGSVEIAGSGNVDANISESADVEIVGSGDVTITGGAKCTVSKVGGGRVKCG